MWYRYHPTDKVMWFIICFCFYIFRCAFAIMSPIIVDFQAHEFRTKLGMSSKCGCNCHIISQNLCAIDAIHLIASVTSFRTNQKQYSPADHFWHLCNIYKRRLYRRVTNSDSYVYNTNSKNLCNNGIYKNMKLVLEQHLFITNLFCGNYERVYGSSPHTTGLYPAKLGDTRKGEIFDLF